MSNYLVFDIETAPRNDAWVVERLTGDIHAPSNYGEAAAAKWDVEQRPAKVASAMRSAALNGTYGQVTAIGWAFRGDGGVYVHAQDDDLGEADILDLFFGKVRGHITAHRGVRPIWVGCNIAAFDMRFLYQRALALGVAMNVGMPYDAKPWSGQVIDLQQWWTGGKWGMPARKEDVCRALGIPIPADAVSGAEMPELFAKGEHEAIALHCSQDVELTLRLLDFYLKGDA